MKVLLMTIFTRIYRPCFSSASLTKESVLRALYAMMVLVLSVPFEANAERTLTSRFNTNVNGNIVLIGNVNLTCTPGSNTQGSPTNTTTCAASLAGGTGARDRNDAYIMINHDLDGDSSSTINSSMAQLGLPAGSTIIKAMLYWSAFGSTSPNRNTVKLKVPGGSYQTITGTLDLDAKLDDNNYQGWADVTSTVAAAGNGAYWVGDIRADTGTGKYAGWSLVVAYSNPSEALRSLTIFDGFMGVRGSTSGWSSSVTATAGPFLTPFNGPVQARVGVVAYEGDRPVAQDTFSVNSTLLSNAANPSGNFYNGTISNLGSNVTTGSPANNNNLQLDIDLLNVPLGVIPNASTSASITVSSTSKNEGVLLAVVTFSTELYVPIVVPNVVKTAEDMSPATPLLRGDTLRWHVVMSNSGYDSATNLTATDIIPAYLTYVPNSMRIVTGPNAGNKTDAQYDDQADLLVGPNRVVFRLGAGANASQGGTLAYGQSTSFYFDTIVNEDTPSGTILTNSVQIEYNSQTLPATTFAASSAAASATVMGPPTISKTFSPGVIDPAQSAVMTITLSNPASNPENLTGVSFSDTYPVGLVNTSNPNPQINCTPGSTAGTLNGGAANGNSIGVSPGATIAPNGVCTISVNVTSMTAGNYTNTTSAVTSNNGGAGSTASAVLYVGKPRIAKVFAPATINAGAVSTLTLTLQNTAPTALTQVAFSDTLTNMQVAPTPNVTNSCGGAVSAAPAATSIALNNGALPGSASCTVTVDVTSNVAGTWPNTTTGVSSLESGAAGQPSNTAELTVVGPPLVSKSFLPLSVRTNEDAVLSLVLTNPNTGTTLTNVGLVDNYPSGMVNASPHDAQVTCTTGSTAPAPTATDGGSSVSLGGTASLAAGGSCTITVNVRSASVNSYSNTTNAVTSSAGTGGTAHATLIVANRLSATKAFSPTSIASNNPVTGAYTSSVMSITVTATGGATVNGINYEDSFPAGLIVANTPNPVMGSGCAAGALQGRTGSSGWGPVVSGNTALRLSGVNLSGGGSCVVSVNVTANSSARYTNTTGRVYSTNGGTAGPATAWLDVLGPPVISKSFNPTVIAVRNGDSNFSTLTITLSNPTTAQTGLTGVTFTDIFPADMTVRTGGGNQGVTNTCGGNFTGSANGGGSWNAVNVINGGDTAVRLTGGTLAANATCTLTVSVQGRSEGVKANTIAGVSASNGGTGAGTSASLLVGAPTLTKAFGCTQPIIAGNVCQYMTLAITAPTANALETPGLDDIFPLETALGGGFTLYDTTWNTQGSCPAFSVLGRTGSAGAWGAIAAGNTAIRAVSTGNIPAGTTCTLRFRVTSTTNATNIIPVGGLTGKINGFDTYNAVPGQAVLQVYDTPTIEKSFAAPSMLVNGVTEMRIELSHLNSASASGVAFEDIFPSVVSPAGQMRLASPLVYSHSCSPSGTLESRNGGSWRALTAGDTGLRWTGGTIPGAGSCVITANVTADGMGSYTNTIPLVTTTNIGNSQAPASASITVMAPPSVAKAFTPDTIIVNETSLMTLTFSNPNAAVITGAGLTDTYPAGMVNTAMPNVTTSCAGATITAAAGSGSLVMTGATIPANGFCTINVEVTSATGGAYNNTTGTLTTSNAGVGAAASATLTVSPYMPSISLLKSVALVSDPVNNLTNPKAIPGSLSDYTVRLTNAGQGAADSGSIFIRDALPAQLELFVGVGSGPGDTLQGFVYTNGSPASGLSCSFAARNDGSDCIDFSTDGVTYTYTPAPGPDGFDPAITHIQFRPSGTFNAAGGGGNPWAEFSFRVRVK
jgi:uncharacterized repeat protein (TIGR01451 family)